jgi:molybdopterin converting factor subunit 1
VKIRVLFFASCREIAGVREIETEVPDGATAGQAVDRLCETYPRLSGLRGWMALAVNEEYAPAETTLRPGDVLGLIPPVSGG